MIMHRLQHLRRQPLSARGFAAAKQQSGISFLGFLIFAAIAGFFLITAAKVFPAYSEYRSVKNAMEQLSRKPNVSVMPVNQLWSQLDALFNVGYVSTPKIDCLKLDRKLGTLTCAYEYRANYIANVDLAIRFSNTISLTGVSVK
jgi:hypothetical protein